MHVTRDTIRYVTDTAVPGAARDASPDPAMNPPRARVPWQQDLETVGADFFLRYRKRFFEPGILLTLRRENPGAPMLDLWLRLRAGRRLVEFGHGLEALAAIRRGERFDAPASSPRAVPGGQRRDALSRALVRLGGLLSLAFAALTMTAWLGPVTALLSLVAATAVAAGLMHNGGGLSRSPVG
jgi:hypothetical protein